MLKCSPFQIKDVIFPMNYFDDPLDFRNPFGDNFPFINHLSFAERETMQRSQ